MASLPRELERLLPELRRYGFELTGGGCRLAGPRRAGDLRHRFPERAGTQATLWPSVVLTKPLDCRALPGVIARTLAAPA